MVKIDQKVCVRFDPMCVRFERVFELGIRCFLGVFCGFWGVCVSYRGCVSDCVSVLAVDRGL